MIQKNRYQRFVKERGIALVFSLGILSLVMILLLGFAFQARNQEMQSRNMLAIEQARMICEGTLDGILARVIEKGELKMVPSANWGGRYLFRIRSTDDAYCDPADAGHGGQRAERERHRRA